LSTPTLTLPPQRGRENILEKFQISLASILSHQKERRVSKWKGGRKEFSY
jgi:hypothetical protein